MRSPHCSVDQAFALAIFCFLVGEVEVDFFAIVKPYVEATLIAKREFSEAPSPAN
jgi:hypothetical protein